LGWTDNDKLVVARLRDHGDKIVVLLGAYDRSAHDKAPYQQKQIGQAEKRLEDFKRRPKRAG